ncbi:MAG: hypothetical protein RIB93_12300 [Coleofasciculus sp. D1-CHI-01]|uniref:hypothetical protein n=1 Tax=Coleofasciculus sp. D1-CHI-01 TaxID=3068482 RepID=UPI0032F6935F
MKLKIIAFSLLLGLTSLLGACQTDTTTPDETGVEEPTPAEDTEVMPGEEEAMPGEEEVMPGEEEAMPGEEEAMPGEEEEEDGEAMPGEEEEEDGEATP